jgi:hypothetical protein
MQPFAAAKQQVMLRSLVHFEASRISDLANPVLRPQCMPLNAYNFKFLLCGGLGKYNLVYTANIFSALYPF